MVGKFVASGKDVVNTVSYDVSHPEYRNKPRTSSIHKTIADDLGKRGNSFYSNVSIYLKVHFPSSPIIYIEKYNFWLILTNKIYTRNP